MCVAWVLNPQPFAMLTQCSTTEPQEYSPLVPHPWFSLIATLVFVYSNSLLLYQYLNSSYSCRLCCYTLPCERKTKKKIDAPSLLSTLHYPVWDHKEMEQWCSFFRMVDVWRTALRSFWRAVILLAVMRSV